MQAKTVVTPTTVRTAPVSQERIRQSIRLIRGHKVMLDADLAELYSVETGALTRAVRRNIERFPADFMFQLTREAFDNLRRQSGIPSDWGGRRYAPCAFTEQGVAMLSSVLKSGKAVKVNIEIMRAFVQLRQIITAHADLARKLNALESKYDDHFKFVFDAIRQLMAPPRALSTRFESEESALVLCLSHFLHQTGAHFGGKCSSPKNKHPIGFIPPRKKP